MANKCECADSHCPGHRGYSICPHESTTVLYRVDMEDRTGTLFCNECLEDAYQSGLFTDEPEEDENSISCDQCVMLSINGLACHETGCPNTNAEWNAEDGIWVKMRKCFECGCYVPVDSECCNGEEN